jgi:hypothetical protein
MFEIEFPIRRMDWMENTESLIKLTHTQAIDDLMSVLDNPRDCKYSMGELLDVLSRYWNISGSKLLGQATFGLMNLKDKEK